MAGDQEEPRELRGKNDGIEFLLPQQYMVYVVRAGGWVDPEACCGICLRVEIDDEGALPQQRGEDPRLMAVVVFPTPPF